MFQQSQQADVDQANTHKWLCSVDLKVATEGIHHGRTRPNPFHQELSSNNNKELC